MALMSFNYHHSFWIKLKAVYARITLSKVATIFFLFSFFHCFIQGLLQSFLFSVDENSSFLVSSIIREAQVPTRNFAWRTVHHGNETIQLCNDIPVEIAISPCVDVFRTGEGVLPIPNGFRRRAVGMNTTAVSESFGSFSIQAVFDTQGNVTNVALSMKNSSTVLLDQQCTRVLVYADQVLKNSKREELALIGSEFWMFGIAFFAILYDSVPHLLAGHFMRMLSVGWSAYALWRTDDIDDRFNTLLTNGVCGVDLFPGYFRERKAFQIADLLLNAIAFLSLSFMVLKLSKVYSADAFKRVGPPMHVVRLYRLFLVAFVCLQLLIFLVTASISLWIDQLVNGAIASISLHTPIYLGLFIFTMVILLPWLATGQYALRYERRLAMIGFLFILFVFLTCWAIMYYSEVYRWTWIQWPFFGCLTVATQLVMLVTGVVGVYCWRGFDNGLKHYLHVEAALEKCDFEPDIFPNDLEKTLPVLPNSASTFLISLRVKDTAV